MSGNTGWRVLLCVAAIAAATWAVIERPAQLGLDLRGGTQVVLDLSPRAGQTITSDVANRTLEVLRRRVDSLGVSEPNLEVSGDKRIIVELPGVADPTTAVNVIGSTAQLTIHPVLGAGSTTPPTSIPQDQSGAMEASDDSGNVYSLGPAAVTGDGIDTADALPPDQNHSTWYAELKFKGNGNKAWATLTGQEACKNSSDITRQAAFVLDGKVIEASGPASDVQCNVGINGTTDITGSFSQSQAKNLALLIRGGALPVDVKIASQNIIGPELGKKAIQASEHAVIIGGILTILYILVYYRLLGVVAAASLGVYGLLSYATLLGLKLTLTLPGIAGFILAIAMAMDSNVLVYERVKEEFAGGRSMRSASGTGFKNALSAIIDSNATTFIAALTLFWLAVGEVKGFGVTLLVGTAVSIFTTLVILRLLVTGVLQGSWATKRPSLLGLYVGAKFRKRMSENPPDLMRISKYCLSVSAVVIAIGLAGVAIRGIDYGIEFTGGHMLEYSTAKSVDLDAARAAMGKIGFPRAVVQRSGSSDTSIRVSTLTADQLTKVTEAMKQLGGGSADKLRDETVGPSFSKELKHRAIEGLVVGVGLQLLWVAFRFRWTFGIGAVVAMIHDALLVLGLFTWLRKPFDAVFLAALLTIIAYSVNDTVVVFDRIREQRRRRSGESFASVVSDACAQTFPRTINIGLSAMFILAALFFFGGQTLGDFSLALLVGVATGIYSSVFVASPVAVLLERQWPGLAPRTTKSTGRPGGSSRRTVETTSRVKTQAPQKSSSEELSDSEDEQTTESGDEPRGVGPNRASGTAGDATGRPQLNRPAPRPRSKSKSKSKSKKRR